MRKPMMTPILSSLGILFLGLCMPILAHANQRIEGRLLERGTRTPLVDANVFLLPHQLKAVTNATGHFVFESVPEGEIEFVVNLPGYVRLSSPSSTEDPTRLRELRAERERYDVFETTVYGKENERDGSTRSLKAKAATSLPGSGTDPVKAVQNLPGVARVPGLSSQIVIQGSAPEDTRYTLDGHELPIVFHFGGLSSVVLPESLDRIDYLSAGYGPEYGRAIGGLVGVWTKKPERDRFRGFAFVDLMNAGAAIETPVGEKSSLQIGLRKSYIGEVLRALPEDDDSEVNFTAAPSFSDLTINYAATLSERDEFKLVSVFSRDTLELISKDALDDDPGLRGRFANETSFIRLVPQWEHRLSDDTTSRLSFGFGRDWIKVELGDNYFNLRLWSWTSRYELAHRWSTKSATFFGLDTRLAWARVDLLLPDFYNGGGVWNPVNAGEKRMVSTSAQSQALGGYVNQELKPSPGWTFRPGLRWDYFKTTDELLPAPRLSGRRELTSSLALKGGGGLYYQAPTEEQSSPDVGNPDLKAPRAWHAALGIEKDFREGGTQGYQLTVGPFYKDMSRLVTPSSAFVIRNGRGVAENYANSGTGQAYGLETQLKYDFGSWSGWASYTLSRSTRREPGQASHVSAYDQTHNLNLIAGHDFKDNIRISGRFRYVSGNPMTPITGGFYDADNDTYVPQRGPFYSERVDAFWQLDVRIDKKWIYRDWIMTLYLDLQNVTNHKNVENVSYAYDYSTRQDVNGLPMLPIFGIKGEF